MDYTAAETGRGVLIWTRSMLRSAATRSHCDNVNIFARA